MNLRSADSAMRIRRPPEQTRDEDISAVPSQNGEEKSRTMTEKFKDSINYSSLLLENEGPVARDHMANERTFLAWIRTAIGFLTFGVAFHQFYRLDIKSRSVTLKDGSTLAIEDNKVSVMSRLGAPLGPLCIFLGLMTACLGLTRYFQIQLSLQKNFYPASRIAVVVILSTLVAIIIVLLVLCIELAV